MRKPSLFSRHTEAWRCKFTPCPKVSWHRAYLLGHRRALTTTHRSTRPGLSCQVIPASVNPWENRKSQSCFYLPIISIPSQPTWASESNVEISAPCPFPYFSQDLLLTNILKDAMSIHLLMKDKHLTPQPSFHIPQLSNVRCRTACKILCPKAEKSSKAIIASLGKGQLLDCLEMPIHTCCMCVGSRLWSSCGILEKLWQIKN